MVAGESDGRPFFSIGVTTYNRHDLLRETLDSILAQTFTDFEVIVGNDFTEEVLSGEMLGIDDPRVRFVNHPENLREVGNMNALLEMATGRYFTWLFDDDLYEPCFLQVAFENLRTTGYPSAFFCSYRIASSEELSRPSELKAGPAIQLTGKEFLRWYSVFHARLFPTFGVFDRIELRSRVGGYEELSEGPIALYSEYLFLAGCGQLERIVFVDAPLYLYRLHEGSYSETNTFLEQYTVAGRNLINRSREVLAKGVLASDFPANLMKICSLHLIEFAHKLGSHVHYLPTESRNDFGARAACRMIAWHWRESAGVWKQYLSLGGDRGIRSRFEFLKVRLFCNYRILSHYFHFFKRGHDGEQ